MTTEHYEHDDCPLCGTPSVPFEGVSDQSLRGCPNPWCLHGWREDLTAKPKRRPQLTGDDRRRELELIDAWQGEGNSETYPFPEWVWNMAMNPEGTLQKSAERYLETLHASESNP